MAKSLKDHLPDSVTQEDRKFVEKYGNRLSDSTQYAQWISGPDEHEEHPGKSLATRSHEVIRQWAEERGGRPATIAGTEKGDQLGSMRIVFDEIDNERLREVNWDEWFRTFDERNLVFIYQEHLKNGNQSNFFRLDNPDREDG